MEKIPQTLYVCVFNLILKFGGFGIGYSIGRKYQPIRVSVSILDLNQKSGFGHSLFHQRNDKILMDRASLTSCIQVFIESRTLIEFTIGS